MLSEHLLDDPGGFLTGNHSRTCMHVHYLFQLTPEDATKSQIHTFYNIIITHTVDLGCLQVEQQ